MEKHPNIPAPYNTVMPYLILKGAVRFRDFAQQVFGAKEQHLEMRDEHFVRHGQLIIGECMIMFSDATADFEPHTGGFFIYVEDADETYAKALKAGATSVMEVSDQPYGRSGGVQDMCGNTWWVTSVPGQ